MKLKRAIVVILLVVILASSVAALTLFIVEQEASRSAKHGEKLLSAHCAACHAVGRSGASPHPLAPQFRTLFRSYPAESLVESLGEGLTSGHPDMPTFVFSDSEIAAILSYLQSIQEPPK